MIDDILKPKSDQEIEDLLADMDALELMRFGSKHNQIPIIQLGIERADTKVFARDFNASSANFFDSLNLKTYWELIDIDIDNYVKMRRIVDGEEDDFSMGFFAKRFIPIYEDDDILNFTRRSLDKILNKL